MPQQNARVYWAARDLGDWWKCVGNHHFVLIELQGGATLTDIIAERVGDVQLVTLAGNKEGDRLVFASNMKMKADLDAIREELVPGQKTWKPDLDLEKHEVSPPTGGGLGFAQLLEKLANTFKAKSAASPVQYHLQDENCAAWVNSLLKAAGVPLAIRMKAGEFDGVDWGEEDELPQALFVE